MQKTMNEINKGWHFAFEDAGFDYHSLDGKYWIDNYHIELKQLEANALEEASNEVHAMCMELVNHNVKNGNFEKYGLSNFVIEAIEKSWKRDDFHLYGRFDFAYNGIGAPKMLEYNADTPTSIVESSIAQKIWAEMQNEQYGKKIHQLNNLEQAFKNRFKLWKKANKNKNFYFMGDELTIEDWGNVKLLAKWANEEGIDAKTLSFENLFFSEEKMCFEDNNEQEINALFKLYPWEFVFEENNFSDYELGKTAIIEPMWKGLLSTKAILPMLWDMFKGHPNLLPAYFNLDDMLKESSSYVKKPIYSREGANIEVVENSVIIDTESGSYGVEGYIYQQRAKMAMMDNAWYVFGTWMIGDKMEGLAIREDKTVITKNTSFFVPHNIV